MEIICNDYEKVRRNIIDAGKKYLRDNPNIKSLIVGISGGIDSTLVAALAREICDETGCHELIGYSIPIESNEKDEIKRAKLAGKVFCHGFKEIDWIDTCFHLDFLPNRILCMQFRTPNYSKGYKKDFKEKVRAGNLKARIRMMFLYDRAYKHNGLVLSTDNLTEYNLGFWTLHGDVGDFGLIQNLWKTEVYKLADYIAKKYLDTFNKRESTSWLKYENMFKALENAIKAVPTDGLGITDSDFDQLGVDSYQKADKILIEYLKSGSDNKKLEKHPVIKRHLRYAFKRNNPYNIPRENILPEPETIDPSIYNSTVLSEDSLLVPRGYKSW